MEYIKFLKNHRSVSNLTRRVPKIVSRYGFDGQKLRKNIFSMVEDCNRFYVCPTLPVTGQVVGKYPDFFQQFDESQVEFAIHGYFHQDYTRLSVQEKRDQLGRAYKIFKDANVPISGFRFPYLRVDDESLSLVGELPFIYDSSQSFWWEIDRALLNGHSKVVEKMRTQYDPRSPQDAPVLPKRLGSLIEMPVSLPDDDIIMDRVGIGDNELIAKLWLGILEQTVRRNELFVLQLHPERFQLLRQALSTLLQEIRQRDKQIWVAPLREIAQWWNKREEFHVSYKRNGNNCLRVQIKHPGELNYQLLNFSAKNFKITNSYRSNEVLEEFEIEEDQLPLIGVGKETSLGFRQLLTNLGFPFEEVANCPEKCSVYIEKDPETRSVNKWLNQFLSSLTSPLIRFNYWPENFSAAFAVTGDIDALTTQDFFSRIYDR